MPRKRVAPYWLFVGHVREVEKCGLRQAEQIAAPRWEGMGEEERKRWKDEAKEQNCQTAGAGTSIQISPGSGPPKLPGEWVQCPYDKNHWPQKHRFMRHLMKCRKAAGGDECTTILVCEWNYSHHIPAEQYANHLLVCSSRREPELLLEHMEENERKKARPEPEEASGSKTK